MQDDLLADELPRRVAPDDPEAFDRLFEAYADPLIRFVYRFVRSWEEAEDVVQELFMRLWERRETLAALGDVRAYLYTAARNRAMMHLKRRAVRTRWQEQQVAGGGAVEVSGAPDPFEQLAARDLAARVQSAVDALPPRQRDVFLRRCQGESYELIATTLGISPNTISIHLTRALARLKQTLA